MDVRTRLLSVCAGLAVAASACASANEPHVTVLPPRLPDSTLIGLAAPGSGASEPPVAAPSARPASVVESAETYLGAPYLDGGTSPAGFDCSGFVWFVFTQAGIRLPRELVRQFEAGRPVARSMIEPGDLLFFSTSGPGPTHVGIAVGGDGFIHAPNSRGVVRIERMSSGYWAERFLGARRIPF